MKLFGCCAANGVVAKAVWDSLVAKMWDYNAGLTAKAWQVTFAAINVNKAAICIGIPS